MAVVLRPFKILLPQDVCKKAFRDERCASWFLEYYRVGHWLFGDLFIPKMFLKPGAFAATHGSDKPIHLQFLFKEPVVSWHLEHFWYILMHPLSHGLKKKKKYHAIIIRPCRPSLKLMHSVCSQNEP